MKKCLFCAEEIQDEAVLCRYCHKDQPIELPEVEMGQAWCLYCKKGIIPTKTPQKGHGAIEVATWLMLPLAGAVYSTWRRGTQPWYCPVCFSPVLPPRTAWGDGKKKWEAIQQGTYVPEPADPNKPKGSYFAGVVLIGLGLLLYVFLLAVVVDANFRPGFWISIGPAIPIILGAILVVEKSTWQKTVKAQLLDDEADDHSRPADS